MSRNLTLLVLQFSMALGLSLLLTPAVRFLGEKLGAVDQPNQRKVHSGAIPRIGGMAMFLSFLASLLLIHAFFEVPRSFLVIDQRVSLLLAGGVIVFGIGLLDDFHRISHRTKFLFQILGATLAYGGGARITNLFGLDVWDAYGIMSYALTVFWFLLFINAINLIDGLDGLAAGIAFFTATVMATTAMWRVATSEALLFGALAGTCLGFLRYNFNPASIFMGDSGSYFLGYTIAGISILSSSKSELGATILIPLVAMGVPIFDTILAPIRRFIVGKKMFRPDADHVHHRLVALGFSTRRAVLTIYITSVILCGFSLLLINLQNTGIGIFLVSLTVVVFLFMKKLGYLQHIGTDRIYGWIKDVSDEAGLSRERRTFLNLQLEICGSKDMDELWEHTCRALSMLDFDLSRMQIASGMGGENETSGNSPLMPTPENPGKDLSNINRDNHGDYKVPVELTWTRNGFDPQDYLSRECLLKLELPLLSNGTDNVGMLWLAKDLKRSSLGHYTLRRVEHLRRSIMRSLETLKVKGEEF